jgi:hypothetical protein
LLGESQDEEGQEVGDETSEGKTFSSHLTDLHNLVANDWVEDTNSEEVGHGWSPELVERVVESTMSIANTPEEH